MFKVRSPLAAPLLIAAVTAGCIAVGSHVFAAQDQVYRTRFPGHTFVLCRLA